MSTLATRVQKLKVAKRAMGIPEDHQLIDWGTHKGKTFKDMYAWEAGRYVEWCASHLKPATDVISQQRWMRYIEGRVTAEEQEVIECDAKQMSSGVPVSSSVPVLDTEFTIEQVINVVSDLREEVRAFQAEVRALRQQMSYCVLMS